MTRTGVDAGVLPGGHPPRIQHRDPVHPLLQAQQCGSDLVGGEVESCDGVDAVVEECERCVHV